MPMSLERGDSTVNKYDYGYPDPADITPELQAAIDQDTENMRHLSWRIGHAIDWWIFRTRLWFMVTRAKAFRWYRLCKAAPAMYEALLTATGWIRQHPADVAGTPAEAERDALIEELSATLAAANGTTTQEGKGEQR